MMFQAGDSQIYVQSDQELAGPERVTIHDKAVAVAKVTFNQAVSVIRPAATAIIAEIADLERRPDEVEITFGLKFTASAAVLVASGSSESTCTIKAVWKNMST
jgi:hypothetical protein